MSGKKKGNGEVEERLEAKVLPPEETLVREGLEQALAPMQRALDEQLLAVAREAIKTGQDLDLATLSDESLMDEDTIVHARIAYVTSLLRLCHFLRRQPQDFNEEAVQAKIGQAHIRHVESSQLEALQMGRKRADVNWLKEVNTLKARVAEMAEKKARFMIDSGEVK